MINNAISKIYNSTKIGRSVLILLVFSLISVGMFAFPTSAQAASLIVKDQSTCESLPATTTWNASTSDCLLQSNLTINSSDILNIQDPVRLIISAGNTLTNNGGTISIILGGRLNVKGSLINENGGIIDNKGFWTLREGGLVNNKAGSEVVSTNQIHATQGTFMNEGTLTNGPGSISVGLAGDFINTGNLVNTGNIFNRGTFTNENQISNSGLIRNECVTFINNGSISGNPVIDTHCWGGGVGLWSNPSKWNLGNVPPNDAYVIIKSGGSVHIDFALTFTGYLRHTIGQLIIDDGGSLTNEGTIYMGGINFPGTKILTNNGLFTNNGDFLNADRFVNNGVFINNNAITPSGTYGQLWNYGIFTNASGGYVNNKLMNYQSGVFKNYGTYDMNPSINNNMGTFSNKANGTLNINNQLINENGSRLYNYGTLNVTHALTNPGEIDNQSSALIVNQSGGTINITASGSAINNAGLFRNFSSTNNSGTISNSGIICGDAIIGNPVVGDPPMLVCDLVPPVLDLPPSITVEATSPNGQTVNIGTASATDNVDPHPLITNNAPAYFPLGTTVVTWTAKDFSWNYAAGTQNVNVVDTTPPILTVPPDVTVEASAQYGQGVNIGTASATDIVDLNPEIMNYSPSLFLLGTTIVNWTSTDFSGNTTSIEQRITVVDTTPPELTVPLDITVTAPDPAGAVVTFDVVVFDVADPHPDLSCDHESGDLYPLGTTVVTCTSVDVSGNGTTDSFSIDVIVDTETFEGFIEEIISLDMDSGTENSITVKIDTAMESFDRGNVQASVNQLNALLNYIDSQEGKKISEEDAELLRSNVLSLIEYFEG